MTRTAASARDGRTPEVTVVGIGASAGGVDAPRDFFTAVPPDPGVAFVVIRHMEPSHESRMAEILGKHTGERPATMPEGWASAGPAGAHRAGRREDGPHGLRRRRGG